MNRVKSLDGLRAISIMMVLLAHIARYLPAPVLTNYLYIVFSNSEVGVSIFFVISGYLITKLLLIEKEKTGTINLKHFYIRRVLRIFPIFYLYILLVLVLKLFVIPDIINNYIEILFAALYLWNYKHLFKLPAHPNGTYYFGHYWSLAMEEQFYFFWPITFAKLSRDTLIKLVITIVALMPFLRIATYFIMPGSRGQLHMMIQTGGDTIMMGCLGALLENKKEFKDKYFKYLTNTFLAIFGMIYILVISRYFAAKYEGKYSMTFGQSIDNTFILIIVLWCIHIPTKFASFLNNKLVMQIGVISYSIYIWHIFILRNPKQFLPDMLWVKIIAIFAVGFASYYLIEKPILRLKKRFKDI